MNIFSKLVARYSIAILVGFGFSLLLSGCSGLSKKCVNGDCSWYKDGKKISDEEAARENSYVGQEIERDKKKQVYQDELKNAPRRTSKEIIWVALLMPESVTKGQVTLDRKIQKYWNIEFQNDKRIKLISQKKMKKYIKTLEKNYAKKRYHRSWFNKAVELRVPGDVFVHLSMTPDDFIGYNKRTKKIAAGKKLVLTAKISSTYEPKEHLIKEDIINIFNNVRHIKKLAKKVRAKINREVRSELPSLAWINERRQKSGEAAKKGLSNWLQGLKKKSKK